MALRGLAELWPGEVMIFVHELPGCFSTAATFDDAQAQLRTRVDEHLLWLAERGLEAPAGLGPDVEIAEQLEPVAGHYGPLFELDGEPLTAGEISHALTVAAAARDALLETYRAASPAVRARRPAEGEWSIDEHFLHIAGADCYYLSGILAEPADTLVSRLPSDPQEALIASGQLAEEAFADLLPADPSRVTKTGHEAWTPRKTLRRMTSHLREHAPWIRALARG